MGGRQEGGAGQQVLYHQLGQEELEEPDQELEGERRRIFRAPQPSAGIMDLSIHNRRLFLGCLAVVEGLGLLAVITTIYWVFHHRGGVPAGDMGIPFNWHPILMTVSLVFLYGNGAMVYRVFPPQDEAHKLKLKLAHAAIMFTAFVIMVIGLQAAFDSHNLNTPPKPNLYTLHSWLGLMAALLFSCQWTLGFTAFLFPKFSPGIRALILPFHQYFGSAILALAVGAALMGHLEKQVWANKEYSQGNGEALLVNWTGILLVLSALGTTLLLSKFSTEQKPAIQ